MYLGLLSVKEELKSTSIMNAQLCNVAINDTSKPKSLCHVLCPQCWEYGIPFCRELALQYESLYDYQSLSWIRVSPN